MWFAETLDTAVEIFSKSNNFNEAGVFIKIFYCANLALKLYVQPRILWIGVIFGFFNNSIFGILWFDWRTFLVISVMNSWFRKHFPKSLRIKSFMLWLSKARNCCCFNCATFPLLLARLAHYDVFLKNSHKKKMKKFLQPANLPASYVQTFT